MSSKTLLTIIILFSLNLFSQEKKLSLELSYPLIIGEEINKSEIISYRGIIDLGGKYNFATKNKLSFGAGLNIGMLRIKYNDNFNSNLILTDDISFILESEGYTKKIFTVQPKLFTSLNIIENKLNLLFGLGYTLVFSTFENKTYFLNGLNFNPTLNYQIDKKFFIHLQYDYINYLTEEDNIIDNNLNIIKFGLGIRL